MSVINKFVQMCAQNRGNIQQFNLRKNFREYVKDESYPEFCADQHLVYYPFH